MSQPLSGYVVHCIFYVFLFALVLSVDRSNQIFSWIYVTNLKKKAFVEMFTRGYSLYPSSACNLISLYTIAHEDKVFFPKDDLEQELNLYECSFSDFSSGKAYLPISVDQVKSLASVSNSSSFTPSTPKSLEYPQNMFSPFNGEKSVNGI